ncbi:uncharacterized protein LOC132202421 [Neocloeon triangulifer]|uniref:uncharacterized protein LOC132202421 n=1 Tax=Neocloeon triangulifer TaxID=2078957 RepID=UPI00286F7623|nr:uncharacterized protein LOC132202421 [Neocloeon triangulifer]XP_059485312.1 uncharacterized protein LOC132202421 [Neocloeon triangulifer]XP_059485313.1 uncharacterized protein LOC132202421 [Neocloeon triangulifer]XP_059485314.1 uncharacterized protein LOC132202421 [Neocloeon triangulifer]
MKAEFLKQQEVLERKHLASKLKADAEKMLAEAANLEKETSDLCCAGTSSSSDFGASCSSSSMQYSAGQNAYGCIDHVDAYEDILINALVAAKFTDEGCAESKEDRLNEEDDYFEDDNEDDEGQKLIGRAAAAQITLAGKTHEGAQDKARPLPACLLILRYEYKTWTKFVMIETNKLEKMIFKFPLVIKSPAMILKGLACLTFGSTELASSTYPDRADGKPAFDRRVSYAIIEAGRHQLLG